MVNPYVFAPHLDFFIEKARRSGGYTMSSFHMHKKYEIYYQLAGTRRYLIEDSSYFINAGDVVLIDKDEVHKAGSVDNNPHARIVLNFNEEFIAPVSDPLGVDLFDVFHRGAKVISGTMKEQAILEDTLERLLRLEGKDSPESTAMRRLVLCELLLFLAEMLDSQNTREAQSHRISNKNIDAITRYIAANYRENLTLSGIAAQFYLSLYYLSRLFKRTTNLNLMEYINSVRLRAAKDMLETTGLHISEVAEASGFTTAAHFTRMFKAATGLSPQQYRKYYHTRKDSSTG